MSNRDIKVQVRFNEHEKEILDKNRGAEDASKYIRRKALEGDKEETES